MAGIIIILFIVAIIFFISWLALKTIKAAIKITIVVLLISLGLFTYLILADSKDLANTTQEMLFLYDDQGELTLGLKVNLSEQDPMFLTQKQLNELNKQKKRQYDRVFTFTKEGLNSIVDDTTNVEGQDLNKEELFELLESEEREIQENAFALLTFSALTKLGSKEGLIKVLEAQETNDLTIEPPIRVLTTLNFLPDKLVKQIIEKIPLGERETT